ncbi:MAG: AAA family ATPase [Holophaga sp.]|nr:AAA family ATPase [Holophaga sp.]
MPCRTLFPDKAYFSLEALDHRDFAVSDPRGFLAGMPEGAILDEVQRAPGILSYLQEEVDWDARPGRFVLTGSENLALNEAVSQSLAGRTPSWSPWCPHGIPIRASRL